MSDQPPPSGLECPTPDQLAELVLARLAEPARSQVEEHVAACAECRRVVAELARSSVLPPAPPGEGLEAGRAFGRFTIVRTLGVGAMGTVYCAHDPQLDRRVALKVLHADLDSARLLAEARAMARVADPHVTHVHEVATAEERVYLAMELVEGVTLRRWLAERPRSWREIMPVLLQAGAGLAAAHDAGVTHLDFKPENVLVGANGRVRVTDFGLARVSLAVRPRVEGPPDALSAVASSASHAPGTPAYMSPEQFAGERCGPAADQFAFCVVAWEALLREAPFDAGTPPTVQALARAVRGGRSRTPTQLHGVPPAIVRALERGLSTAQTARFSDIRALLRALQVTPPSRVLPLLAVAAVLFIALGTAAFTQRARWLCGAGPERLGTAWDETQRAQAAEAFAKSGAPWASEAWSKAQAHLTRYREGWLEMFRESCEATRVTGEQSSEVLDLRMACLASRRQELAAASAMLSTGDAQTFGNALQLAQGLTPLSACADLEGLALQRPPVDPAVRDAVASARGVLTDALALERSGRYPQALARAREALSLSELTAYAPLVATSREEVGRLQLSLEPDERATKTLEAAFYEAQACGHDEVAGRAAALLVMHEGLTMHRAENAERWERMARAVFARRPFPVNELLLETARSRWLNWQHRDDDALLAARRAVELSRQVYGEDAPNTAARRSDLGRVLTSLHRTDDALLELRASLESLERSLGPEHPECAATRNGIANVLFDAGRYDEAIAEHRRVLSIVRATVGPSSGMAAMTLANLAELDALQGRHELALSGYEQALAITRALGAEGDPILSDREANVADELEALERLPEALAAMQRARDAAARAKSTSLEATELGCEVARLQLEVGDASAALGEIERALNGLAGREAEDPANVTACRFIAARILWTRPGERKRVAELIALARPEADEDVTAQIDEWLRTRR